MAVPADGRRSGSPGETRTDFRLDTQSAGMINNVGGSQNVFLPGKAIVVPGGGSARLTPAERATAVVGLLLFWGGLAFFASVLYTAGQRTYDAWQSGSLEAPYTQYAPAGWFVPLVLMFAGVVVPRLGLRLFGDSAGPG